MDHHHQSLIDFPVVISVPLLWGDHDEFGHVNNLAYLRWCETARVEYLARIGLWPSMPPAGIGPILASMSCHYRHTLRYPDTVWIGARVTRIGNSSIQMQHRVVSESLGAVAAEVESTLVVLDYSRNQAVPVPALCRQAIEQMESALAAAK
jgi:acyl-CoA thioester hydrolase